MQGARSCSNLDDNLAFLVVALQAALPCNTVSQGWTISFNSFLEIYEKLRQLLLQKVMARELVIVLAIMEM